MHILFVPSWYKSPKRPMYGSFIEDQARTLQDNNVKVGIFFPKWDGSFLSGLMNWNAKMSYMEDNGLSIYVMNATNVVPFWNKINFKYICKKSEIAFHQYCREHGVPDLLHAHSVFIGGIVAHHLSAKFNIPFVLTEHSSQLILKPCKRYLYGQVQEVFHSAKSLISVSQFQQDKLLDIYAVTNRSLKIIPNAVNEYFFKDSRNPSPKQNGPFTWINIGSLTDVKNHVLLLNAFALLLNNIPESSLIIIGEGPLEQKLISLSRTLKIENKVQFLGGKNRNEVQELIRNSNALVSSSKLETFGVVVIEALASGRPVVVTNSGGPEEIVTANDGMIVKSQSADQLAGAMQKLMDNYNFYDFRKISENCRERFSEMVIMSKLNKLYQNIILK